MKGGTLRPIAELDRRIPRAGKIKLGAKTEKAMKKLEQFRFLSPFQDCIEAIANQYGGVCVPYHDESANPKDQFQVFTNAEAIEVILIPDGIDACYEQWGGGMRQRLCDGVTCTVEEPTQDDYIKVDYPCICIAENMRRCNPKLRIVVLMPNVPMHGAWLLETGSWFAQNEMPAMFDMITLLGQGGMKRATLSIDKRTDVKFGRGGKPVRRNYVVPVLSMIDTPMQLMAGMADVKVIAAGNAAAGIGSGVATPALGRGTPVGIRPGGPTGWAEGLNGEPLDSERRGDPELDGTATDDDVADAEIVDEELDELERLLMADGEHFGCDGRRFADAVVLQSRTHVKGADPTRLEVFDRIRKCREQMKAGQREPLGFKADGSVDWLVNK